MDLKEMAVLCVLAALTACASPRQEIGSLPDGSEYCITYQGQK